MYDYLRTHAIRHTWCTPGQDREVIFKLAKLNGLYGVWNNIVVLMRNYQLPTKNERYNVYQIGRIGSYFLGLLNLGNEWISFADCMNQERTGVYADIYTVNGIELPRSQVYYRINPDGNIIVAIKEQPKLNFDFDHDDVYIRLYSNAYYNGSATDPINDLIYTDGGVMNSANDIVALQNKVNQYSALKGVVSCFVNGKRTNTINLLNTKIGDVVEFVYDGSIYAVRDYPIKDLDTFNSLLDNKSKYLLHHTGPDDGTIDYEDDLDFFLLTPGLNNSYTGVYYHRNTEDALRMVTHRDYSILTQQVNAYLNSATGFVSTDTLFLRVHYRKSGYNRPLINEANRIKELYKLPEVNIREALLGVNSNLSNWRADVLEKSAYTLIMRSQIKDITRSVVKEAYGYNAISRLIGLTPSIVQPLNGVTAADVPLAYQTFATFFEYDINGVLLDWRPSRLTTNYVPLNPACVKVDMIKGYGTLDLDDVYNQKTQVLNTGLEYRMYLCGYLNGAPDNIWQDVTGSSLYSVDPNTNMLTWLLDQTVYYTCVRSNRNSLCYDVDVLPQEGVLRFSLNQNMLRNGENTTWVMQIPMGDLDLHLNGYPLIENIDYFVNFPEIVIIGKQFLNQPATTLSQRINVRFSGFCDHQLGREPQEDVGYINHGLISENKQFNIRDDRVMRITAGGSFKDVRDLVFSETNQFIPGALPVNGMPYQVKDSMVPMKTYIDSDSYEFRKSSRVIDKAVSDYMSQYMPQPDPIGVNVLPGLWKLYTPFLSAIITDLTLGDLYPAYLKQYYTDQDVRTTCTRYEYLLKYDPLYRTHLNDPTSKVDATYTYVDPFIQNGPVTIDVYQYKFLNRVIQIYLKGYIDITSFITIVT